MYGDYQATHRRNQFLFKDQVYKIYGRFSWMNFTEHPISGGSEEDDGVLLSLASPFSDDLPSVIVVLDARNMTEISRAYIPGLFAV